MATKKKGRRSPGQGSVSPRKDGRFEGIVHLGYDAAGKRQRLRVYGKTRREVQEKLIKLLADRQQGILNIPPEKLTFGQFLDRWIQDQAAQIRPSTLSSYKTKIEKHIKPALGALPLKKLHAVHLQEFYTKRLNAGLSRRTVQYIHAIIHVALERAVRWDLVIRNVADLVDAPRPQKYNSTPLEAEQAQALIKVSEGHRLHGLIVLALSTGMRRGELLGLRWSDVSIEEKVLKVEQTIQRVERKVLVGDPKSLQSKRMIPLSDIAVAALEAHRERQEQERAQIGDAYNDQDLVFCRPCGAPLDEASVSRLPPAFAKKAGLPSIRFHDLRHTYATLLMNADGNLKVISDLLGHSSISITANLYGKTFSSSARKTTSTLDTLLTPKSAD